MHIWAACGLILKWLNDNPGIGIVTPILITIVSGAAALILRTRKRPAPNTADGPYAAIREVYEGQQVSLLVTNRGHSAEFYGQFDVQGPVGPIVPININAGGGYTGLFCRWGHTDSWKTQIAKGQTCRILLSELRSDFGFSRWRIETVSDGGPVQLEATYTSCAVTSPPNITPDIVLAGSVFAKPDAVNGPQSFRVVLKSFDAEISRSK